MVPINFVLALSGHGVVLILIQTVINSIFICLEVKF
jgi:hypothetical protein